MAKIDPQELTASWQKYSLRPTWGFVSSRELSEILDVHLQTINNWLIRGILPPAEAHPRIRGNKNWWRIAQIMTWLNPIKSEADIHDAWIKEHIPVPMQNLAQAQEFVQLYYTALEVERV